MSNIRFDALKKAFNRTPVVVDVPEGKVKDYFARDVFTRENERVHCSRCI